MTNPNLAQLPTPSNTPHEYSVALTDKYKIKYTHEAKFFLRS